MPIKIREIKGVSIVDIEGNIDINSSDIIETVGWLTSTGKLNIVLNLENVDMVDYSGLSILAIAYKSAANHKGRLKLLHASIPVMELLKVVKLDSIFETYSDEESAVNSFYTEGMDKLHLRRKFQRLEMHLDVKYRIVSDQKSPKEFEGKALNISAAGMYIYSTITLPLNTLLDLDLTLPGASSNLIANGKVVYLADKQIQPHVYPGMGVSFVHLTPEKEKLIIDFIDKNVSHRAGSDET